MVRRRFLVFPFALVFVIALAACSPVTGTGQSQATLPPLSLSASQSLGQTFTARQAGLAGVVLYLLPGQSGNGIIHLGLYPDPVESQVLAATDLPSGEVTAEGWRQVLFSPPPDLPEGDYFLSITFTGSGSIYLANAGGASYLNGSAYINGQPAADQQLAFNLLYQPGSLAAGLGREGLNWGLWLFLGMLLFVVPGWGLMSSLWPAWGGLSWPEKLGLGTGISLALYPILILWTSLVGLHLGAVYAWLPFAAALAWLAWKNRTAFRAFSFRKSLHVTLPDAALVVVIALIAVTRFYIARVLPVPLWNDSVHHTAITQLLVDNGGLFSSWQPYFDLQSLGYHFGFHSDMAVFHWLSGLSVPQSVLWGGQVLNIFSVLPLYPLALKLGKNRWAGVAAVLAGGLVGLLPNFYINWSLYTLLAGHTILAVLLWMVWTALENEQRPWKALALAGVALGGLALTHYRVLIYAVLFLLVMFLASLRRQVWVRNLVSLAGISAIGFLVFLPWFIHLLPTGYMAWFNKSMATGAGELDAWTITYNTTTGPMTSFLPLALWILMPLAAAWGLWRRERLVAVLLAWIGLIALAANPNWIGLPGAGLLKNFSVLTGIYIPAAVLTGAGFGWLAGFFKLEASTWRKGVLVLAIISLAVWGARQRLQDLQPENFTTLTWPDMRAFTWVDANTPAGARFLVNSNFTYGGGTIAGSDAGWWLPLLTGRLTDQPPIPYTMEKGSRPDSVSWTNYLPDLIRQKGPDAPEVLAELQARQISYVYIGQRQGLAGNWTNPPLLDPAVLSASPHYSLLYHQDRVYVFKLVQ